MPVFVPETATTSVAVKKNGTTVGTEPTLNFLEGSNISLGMVDNPAANRLDITVTGVTSDFATALLATSPSSFWPFNETAGTVASDVQSGLNGTIAGTVTLNQAPLVTGGGTSFYFDTGDGVQIGTSAYRFSANSPFTVAAWIDPVVSAGGVTRQTIMSCQTFSGSTSTAGWSLIVLSDGSTSAYSIQVERHTSLLAVSGYPYTLGQTHYAAATYNGTGTLTIVVDGVQVAQTTSSTVSVPASAANLTVGNNPALTAHLGGYVDAPAVWTRALSVPELATLNTAGR